MCFNPRAREGRDDEAVQGFFKLLRFNPRAREGRDALPSGEGVIVMVSIHAPARGATNSRPVTRSNAACFNPRAREGRDESA